MVNLTSPFNVYLSRLNAYKSRTDDKHIREMEKKE